MSNSFQKTLLIVTLTAKIFFKYAGSVSQCAIHDESTGLCFYCGVNYYSENNIREISPFPEQECLLKNLKNMNISMFVYLDSANCENSICDGSLQKPFKTIDDALNNINRLASMNSRLEVNLTLFTSMENCLFFWNSEGRKEYFRRANLKLTIKPGYCNEFPGSLGCIEINKAIKIILKSSSFRIFISNEIKLENIILDARDLVLPTTNICLTNRITQICCDDKAVYSLFDEINNLCGIYRRQSGTQGQPALFNIEIIHDDPGALVPALIMSNVTLQNFQPFGINYLSLVLLVKNLQGNVSFNSVQIINSTFAKAILLISPYFIFADHQITLIPFVYKAPTAFSSSFQNIIIMNYNAPDVLEQTAYSFNFEEYQGAIIFKNLQIRKLLLRTGSLISARESKNRIEIIIEDFIMSDSFLANFLYSEHGNAVSIINGVLFDNQMLYFLFAEGTVILNLQGITFKGLLPYIAFVSVISSQVYVQNCNFHHLIEPYPGVNPVLFLSESEFAISLSDQFNDGDFNRPYTAKDSFFITNTNITDSDTAFNFLSCDHSVLEVKLSAVKFYNLSIQNIDSAFISLSPEKNFTIEYSLLEKIKSNYIIIRLQPCIRLLFLNSTFKNLESEENHIFKFESRTTKNKLTHVFSLKGILLEDVILNFKTDEFERYVIFSEHRSMGDGGSLIFVDSIIKRVHFEREVDKAFLLSIYCVNILMNNIFIESVSNNTILYWSMTADGSSFELTNLIFINENNSMSMFMNTEKDYINLVTIVNCTFRANLVTGSSFLTLNNVRSFKMLNNFFRAAVSGSLLLLRTESIESMFMSENTFEGIPELGEIETCGILYGSNKIDKSVSEASPFFGIHNTIFKNLMTSAVIVSEKSEFLLVNASFSNISSFASSLIVIQPKSFVLLCYIYVEKIRSFSESAVFSVSSSSLFLSYGFIADCETKYGQGGVLFGKESEVIFKEINFFNIRATVGGLIMSDDCNIFIQNVLVSNSSADSSGGSIFSNIGSIWIENVIFSESRAKSRGGCIFSEITKVNIKNVTIKHSYAGDVGIFLLFNDASGISYLKELSFINNKAKSLPTLGIYDSLMKASNLYISGNSADVGENILEAYSFSSVCSLTLIATEFKSNIMVERGSLISVIGSRITIQDCVIIENKVPLYISADLLSEIFISNSSFFKVGSQNFTGSPSFINLKKSALTAEYSVFSGNQSIQGLTSVFCSKIELKHSTFTGCLAKEGALIIKNSFIFNLIGCMFENISGKKVGVLYIENSQALNIESSIFIGNDCSNENCASVLYLKNELLYPQLQLKLVGLIFFRVLKTAVITSSTSVTLSDSIFLGTPGTPTRALHIIDSFSSLFTGNIILNFFEKGSVLFEASLLLKENEYQVPKISVKNSAFFNCSSSGSGGALTAVGEFSFKVSNSTFLKCSANENGGSIFYSCLGVRCSLVIEERSIFTKSLASITGGAIKTTSKIYSKAAESLFYDNKAAVGANVSSNPSKLFIVKFERDSDYLTFLKNISADNFQFGESAKEINIPVGHEMKLGIFVLDSFDNHLNNINSAIVKTNITNVMSTNKGDIAPKGGVKVSLKSGNGMIANGSCFLPLFSVYSDKINITIDILVHSNILAETIKESFKINIGPCPRGDIFLINRCIPCEENFYSLDNDSFSNNNSACESCPDKSICPGGDRIIPLTGFWRRDSSSRLIKKCLNDQACVYPKDEATKTVCGEEYTGNTCYNCKEGFGKISNVCTECFRTELFWSTFIFGIAIFLGFIIFTKITILNDESNSQIDEKETELLLKLLLNHFSYLAIVTLFDLNWKKEILEIFNFLNSFINSSPQSIFVLDCFFQAPSIKKYKSKFIFVCISPIVFTIICYFTSLFYELLVLSISLLKNFKEYDLRRILNDFKFLFITYFVNRTHMLVELETIFVIICLNIYPHLLMKLVEVFKCVEIAEGAKFVKANPDIQCWEDGHIFYLLFSIIFLFIWGLGIPLYFFIRSKTAIKFLKSDKIGIKFKSIKLTNSVNGRDSSMVNSFMSQSQGNRISASISPSPIIDYHLHNINSNLPVVRTNHEHNLLKHLNLFLVSGYEEKFYYWEAVMFLKKSLVFSITVLINYMDKRSISALTIFLLFSFFLLNEIWPIYKSTVIKKFEGISLIISISTLALGLFSSDEEISYIPKYGSLFLVIAFNLTFLIIWIRAFFYKKIVIFRRSIVLKIQSKRASKQPK